jgi:hypothetical protein
MPEKAGSHTPRPRLLASLSFIFHFSLFTFHFAEGAQFPAGYGQGFPVIEDVEWTGPSLEPVSQYGLKSKIARLDGEKSGNVTVGSLRERYLRAIAEAGWPVPAEPKIDTLQRYEETFFRMQGDAFQRVELEVFSQKDVVYLVVKAWPDRKLTTAFEAQRVPAWHLPKGYGEVFPVFPMAEVQLSEVRTVGDKEIGVEPFPIGYLEARVPGYTVEQIRDWYLGRLREDKWPVPSFFNRDDDDHFQQSFSRRRDGYKMGVELELRHRTPEEPVLLMLRGQANEKSNVTDEMMEEMQRQKEAEKASHDPAKLIVDVDPADPDIDILELPRGWGAGFPVHPETQFITAKLLEKEVIGQKWREARIEGVLMALTVPEAAAWYMEAAGKAGYEVPTIHEEEEPGLFQTRFTRNTGSFMQGVKLKVHTRSEDGLTQVDIVGQEDQETGGAPEDAQQMMTMPQ